MTNEEKLSKALQDFKTKYPSITSADLQTFIIGWQEAVKNCFIPDVSHELPPREIIKEIAQKYTSTHTDVRKELTKKLMTLVYMDGFITGYNFSRGNCA